MAVEYNSIITQIVQVSPIMKIIRVKPEGWELPKFEAGQFVALGLMDDIPRCEEATDEFKEPKPGKIIRSGYPNLAGMGSSFINSAPKTSLFFNSSRVL